MKDDNEVAKIIAKEMEKIFGSGAGEIFIAKDGAFEVVVSLKGAKLSRALHKNAIGVNYPSAVCVFIGKIEKSLRKIKKNAGAKSEPIIDMEYVEAEYGKKLEEVELVFYIVFM